MVIYSRINPILKVHTPGAFMRAAMVLSAI